MTQDQLLIMKYLAKDGYKDFNGELLSNGDRALGKKVTEDKTLEEQYACALALEEAGLIRATTVQRGEIGDSDLLGAVRIELTQKGIQYIEENKETW